MFYTLDKKVFLSALDELLIEEGFKRKDIEKRTSIPRTSLGRMLDSQSEAVPSISQALEICEMLDTTLYYLLFRKGPKQASPHMLNRMIEVMKAFSDHRTPNKGILIDRVVEIQSDEALFMLRKLSATVLEITASLRGGQAIEDLKALERQPLND